MIAGLSIRPLRSAKRSALRVHGFTLIEIMIVVVIIAILATIALPSYATHVMKARRAQGKADLLELSQMLERQYTVNRSYAGFATPFTVSPRDPGTTTAYGLNVENAAATYTITATPEGPQVGDLCGVLTIDQTGKKTHSAGDNDTCSWGTAP